MSGLPSTPITPEVERIIDLLRFAIADYMNIRADITSAIDLSRQPAHFEADGQLLAIIRQIQAVNAIAEADLALYIPATALSRGMFELAVHMLWMLTPADHEGQVARWCRIIKSHQRSMDKFSRYKSKANGDPVDFHLSHSKQLQTMYDTTVASLSPEVQKKYQVDKYLPPFEQLFPDGMQKTHYPMYMILSQFTHPTLEISRALERDANRIREGRSTVESWYNVYRVVWFALREPTRALLDRVGASPADFLGSRYGEPIEKALMVIHP
jgi:hypothetical protein